jgi:hypothetical protein
MWASGHNGTYAAPRTVYLGQPPMNAVMSAPAMVPTMEATAPIVAPTM